VVKTQSETPSAGVTGPAGENRESPAEFAAFAFCHWRADCRYSRSFNRMIHSNSDANAHSRHLPGTSTLEWRLGRPLIRYIL
jgi:hypothetical protein